MQDDAQRQRKRKLTKGLERCTKRKHLLLLAMEYCSLQANLKSSHHAYSEARNEAKCAAPLVRSLQMGG